MTLLITILLTILPGIAAAQNLSSDSESVTIRVNPKKRSSPCNDIISSTKLLIIELFFSRLE
ncbi:MAG: hypothetical protein KZQ56_12580, partial [gamma proteobacterium symbiont of Lucinoma myriamae]|nr:hypothetical protein [gamma proteobacterium symbiont of Lucinoma myriamae]